MGRPITLTIGPLAAEDADNIGTSQTAAGAQALVLNGVAADAVANNICASQTPSGAGSLTLNGSAVIGGVGHVPGPPIPRRIYVTSAGDDTGVTFTIIGTLYSLGGLPVAVSETVTGADTGTISTTKVFNTVTSVSVSGATAAAVTVGTNGFATLDAARHVIITSGADDTGITFTLSGYDGENNPISEAITGVDTAAAESVLDYKVITSVTVSGATASTVEIGTNTVAGSPWVRFDGLAANSQVAIQCDVSGTVSASVQQTLDDPNTGTNSWTTPTYLFTPSEVQWLDHPDTALVDFSSTVQGNYAYAPIFARVVLNSGDGSVTATFQQAFLGG